MQPEVSVTSPVGMAFPVPPLTVTVTVVFPVAPMLDGFGDTTTVGETGMETADTVTEAVPEPLLRVDELLLSGVYAAVSVSEPTDNALA